MHAVPRGDELVKVSLLKNVSIVFFFILCLYLEHLRITNTESHKSWDTNASLSLNSINLNMLPRLYCKGIKMKLVWGLMVMRL